jgi:hypothetical protein
MLPRLAVLAAVIAATLTASCAQVQFAERGTYEIALIGDQGKLSEAQDALGKALQQQAEGKSAEEYTPIAKQALAALDEVAQSQKQLSAQRHAALCYDQGLCYLLLGKSAQASASFNCAARLATSESLYSVMAQQAYFQELDSRFDDANKKLETEVRKVRDALGNEQEAAFSKIREDMGKYEERQARHESNMNAILWDRLGKSVKIELSPGFEADLKAVEASAVDPKTMAMTAKARSDYRNKIEGLANVLPAWAEKEYLPRIEQLRWTVDALEVLAPSVVPSPAVLDTMEDLMQSSARPRSGYLLDALQSAQVRVAANVAADRKEALVDKAGKALLQKDLDLLSEIWVDMEPYVKDGKDPKATAVRNRVRSAVVSLQAASQLNMLKEDLDRYNALANSRLKTAGLNQLLQSCMAQQLALSAEKDVPTDLRDNLQQLTETVQSAIDAMTANRMLKYQQWALEQIKSFNLEYRDAEDHSEYGKIASAIIEHLNPINRGLLDTTIGLSFDQAMQKAWKKIEGEKYSDGSVIQEWVAESASKTPKKGVGDE